MSEVNLATLLDPFAELPPEFPREIGVFVYNADFDYLKTYSLSTKDIRYFQEELQKLHEGKTWYSVFTRMTDRAIEGKKSTQGDKKVLRVAFLKYEDYTIRDEEENDRWFPFVSTKPGRGISYLIRILFQWTHYVWRGTIKIRRCKAKDCDKIFIPIRADHNYCSVNCRTRAFHQIKRQCLRRDLTKRRNKYN